MAARTMRTPRAESTRGCREAHARRARGGLACLRDDRGSILPLVVFFAALCLALVLLAASASSLYLERERLFALADGAALAGADAWEAHNVEVGASGPRVRLTTPQVQAAVGEYLASAAADGFDALRAERVSTVDGRSATVTLSATWHPPVVSIFVPEGIQLVVTSSARSIFG
jgi:hypothetical protein